MGYEVHGVEISKKAAEEAKKILDDVIVGDIEEIELPYPEGYFDVIICADVLEHLFDPKSVLIKLRYYLNDEGILVTSIPNIANWKMRLELLQGRFEYTQTGILDSGHIRFFTYYTARRMLEETGFRITKVEYTSNWWDLPRLLRTGIYAVRKILPFKFNSPHSINLFGYQVIFTTKKGGE